MSFCGGEYSCPSDCLVDDGDEFTETKDILNCQTKFCSKLYSENSDLTDENNETYVGENEKKLLDIESETLEGELNYTELAEVLKNIKNGKSPGQDGFTVKFFKFFWIDIGYFILRSLNYGYRTDSLSITQKQGIITYLNPVNVDIV